MKFRKSRSSPDRLPESTTIDLVLAQDGDPDAFRRVVVATEADVRRFCVWLCQCNRDRRCLCMSVNVVQCLGQDVINSRDTSTRG